jgi:catechol 2,3-dioxygenase-like lactoylglutathione lyase family enzyme
MTTRPRIKFATIVLDCPDAHALAAFYSRLLGWEKTKEDPYWVLMRDPKGGTGMAFQSEEDYVRPVWPEEPGKPQKGEHMDFLVDDLEAATKHALECGATLSPVQYFKGVKVFFDPAGHPFCLFEDPGHEWEES